MDTYKKVSHTESYLADTFVQSDVQNVQQVYMTTNNSPGK